MKTPIAALGLSLLSLVLAGKKDFAAKCYSAPLPTLTSNAENRTIPWGAPEFRLPNGTLCCSSLDQIRDRIDDVDSQLLELVALRSGYGNPFRSEVGRGENWSGS